MAVQLTRRRFSVDEYHWMARVGILGPDDRVELIDGEILEMAPIGPQHVATVLRCSERFAQRFGDVAHVYVESPIHLDVQDEPQPDLALIRRRADFYRSALPRASDALLVVEVADTTLASDLNIKLPRYARAGVAEVWLIDLQHEVILVHREPESGRYRLVTTARRGDTLAPLAMADRPVAVADLLG